MKIGVNTEIQSRQRIKNQRPLDRLERRRGRSLELREHRYSQGYLSES